MIFNTLRDPLGADFGSLRGRSWNPKSIQNRSQERSNKKAKIFQKPQVFPWFWGDQKSIKIGSEMQLQRQPQEMSQKMPNMTHFGTQVGPILGSKMDLEAATSEEKPQRKSTNNQTARQGTKRRRKAAQMEPQGRDRPGLAWERKEGLSKCKTSSHVLFCMCKMFVFICFVCARCLFSCARCLA